MKNIFKKLFGTKPKPSTKAVTAVNEFASFGMTLDDWRKEPKLVEDARVLFSSSTWKLIEQVMRNESPVNYVPVSEGQNPTKDLQTLGDIRGYHKALNNLDALSKPSEELAAVEATFEPENKDQ